MPHDIRKKIFIIAILLLFVGTTVPYNVLGAPLGDHQEDSPNVEITINNIEHGTRVEYHIHEFSMENIAIEGEKYSHIILDGGSNILVKDMPDLPSICRSIIVPENVKMNVKIVSAQYIQYDEMAIVPSKGNLLRTIDPKDVPYEFDDIYTDNTWYPQDIAELGEPYIFRDFCGQVVKITPFQYNPVQKQLRFYTDIIIEIYPVEPDTMSEYFQYDEHQLKIDADLTEIYGNQFINFYSLYAPLEEHGHMLIITNDSFWSAMVPFVQWKNMKGIQTEMAKVSEIGNATAIKNYIAQYYHTYGLTYVLLVGDAAQVPTIMVSNYASDPSYSYIVGDDHYPDVFVGRFSAETTGDVETQVTRTINYEKYPQLQADWYHNGTGIASNQGTGDDNEY
ncbi:MAG: C25 family cysteine peptidase, partial [Euryarchaeota archaeon]|nr:C25 family cysteine peptidase [Euryarchaeota archaeon]